jgi:hypothetical protein
VKLKRTIKKRKASDFHKGIHEFKKEYQTQMPLMKDRNSDPLIDFHCILGKWRNLVSYEILMHPVNLDSLKYILPNQVLIILMLLKN